MAAIDRLGPTASVEDIATAASVSKPVLYRYFSDKADLHAAVGAYGADLVLERLAPALVADGTLRDRVDLACDAYLALLDEHPNVFLLLVQNRVGRDQDPLADGKLRSPRPSPGDGRHAPLARRRRRRRRAVGARPGGARALHRRVVADPPHDEPRRGVGVPLLVRVARAGGHLPQLRRAARRADGELRLVTPPETGAQA